MKYQRAIISHFGGAEVLKIIEEDLPEPRSDSLRIKILASGVAFGDILKRQGVLPGLPKRPFTPGYDCVGIIDKVGKDVIAFKPGQRVAAFIQNGGNAEYIMLP